MSRLAIFGAGRIGQIHARNAVKLAGVDLVHIVDPIAGPSRDTLAAETGATVSDAESVFADTSLDGVIVASSTDTHADILIRAADAGFPVFCEKPISLDFGRVEAVAQKVSATGVPVMLGFQRRYDASFRAVRDRIASGAAGRLEHVIMQSRDPSPPPASYVKTSGGMFRDTAIHDMDMARFLLEEDVATVYAVGSCLISPEIGKAGDIDTLMITLTTGSGRMAQVTNCRRGPMGYDQRLEALCSDEVLFVENQPQSTVRIVRPEGATTAPPENYFLDRFAQAYRDEMAAFVAMIRTGAAPLATLTDGVEAQRLVEAAIISHQTGAPVQFSPDWRP
ncbi:inositol 2-dehydrogenase [Leisingera sp. ANG59]|uniref:inositol 2-dehydrogenase n=1 Tax=Leisingera sp. ANG59 TaxID=2675221 RepID=UPI00157182F1|nr:inositol 2-dehydrogenase [Leisingera sp. ANG59]NSY40424.1 inositol 2-dehydrogenase [Leisingera sp. ANG59]